MHSTLGHAHSDQDSLASASQAFLECLDRHGPHGRLNSAYEGIIRICLAEILQTTPVKPQRPVALDEAMSLSSTDFSIPPLTSTLWHSQGQEYGHISQGSVGVTGTQSEETDPALGQLFTGRVSYIRSLSFTHMCN